MEEVQLIDIMIERAERAVMIAASGGHPALDFTPGSIETIEAIVSGMSRHFDQIDNVAVHAIAEVHGSYVLEVGRRTFGGIYQWHDGTNQPVLVVGLPDCSIAMMTYAKVRGRLAGDEGDNLPFHYAGFAQRASVLEPGTSVAFV